jgi:hypothetical protein
LGRLAIAINALATPCVFIVGAVRSDALAKAAHPAGDIAPATASTLPKACRALATPCAFIAQPVQHVPYCLPIKATTTQYDQVDQLCKPGALAERLAYRVTGVLPTRVARFDAS